MRRALLVVVLVARPASADPPGVPVQPVHCPVGKPTTVVVAVPKEFGCTPAFTADECLWFPGETDGEGRKSYLVQPHRAGVYRVVFWTKGETVSATLTIHAAGEVPAPPQPQPTPHPVPPPQPGPQPPAPAPVDPLVATFQAAYNAEPQADKAARLASLVTAMKDASGYPGAKTPAGQYTYKTNADLAAAVSHRTNELVGAGQIPAVRKAVGDHLGSLFPTLVFDMTADHRKKFADEYARVAKALEGVK